MQMMIISLQKSIRYITERNDQFHALHLHVLILSSQWSLHTVQQLRLLVGQRISPKIDMLTLQPVSSYSILLGLINGFTCR